MKIRFNLQLKLTVMIVVLMFLIISLRATALGIAQSYLDDTLILNIVSAGISILLGALGAYIIILVVIKKPIIQLTELANAFIENDYSKRIHLKSGDEFEQLGHVFNKTAEKMEKSIEEINSSSNQLSNFTREMKTTIQETQESSEQIASSAEQISTGQEQMSNDINRIVEEINEFTASVQELSANIDNVDVSSSHVMKFVSLGEESVNITIDRAKVAQEKVNGTISNVTKLYEKSSSVNNVINIIDSITEQTNLLALNASIEAARAGDAGKGFSVVAEEVRKLATQSKDSTVQIQGLISEIQNEIKIVVEDAKVSGTEVDGMIEQVQRTEDTIKNIKDAAINIKSEIEDINSSIKGMVESSEKINDAISNTAAVIEESSAGLEEVASSSDQQLSYMKQLSGMGTDLQNLSVNLNELIRYLTIKN